MKNSNLFVFTIVCVVEQIFVQTSLSGPVDIVEEYNVTMTNSGPAFFGSNLTFSAELFMTSKVPKDTKYFRYEWQSSADHLRESQNADMKTSLTRCYSLINPGTYDMLLKVYNEKLLKRELVARTSQRFTITDHVNGELLGSQKELKNTTERMTFSTEKPVEIAVDLSDTFMDDPSFTYTWFLNGENETDANVTSPVHHYSINETGFHYITVEVHSHATVLSCDGFNEIHPKGEFQADLMLYDSIGAVQIVGKKTVKNNTFVTEVVYFNGSSPFNVSWEFRNLSSGGVISSGFRKTESSPVTIELRRNLAIGEYYFLATVENPVSMHTRRHNFTVAYHGVPTHSATIVVLPVLGGLAFVCLVLAVIVYVAVPRWKGRHVETADFDFHPSLNLGSNGEEVSKFDSFKSAVRRLLLPKSGKTKNTVQGQGEGQRAGSMSNYGSLGASSSSVVL